MFKPKVIGIICTAKSGSISYSREVFDKESSLPVTRHPSVPKKIQQLDKSILDRVIRDNAKGTIFVAGSNTYEGMMGLKSFTPELSKENAISRDPFQIILTTGPASDGTDAMLLRRFNKRFGAAEVFVEDSSQPWDHSVGADIDEALVAEAFSLAYRHKMNIVVLGGKTIYKSFARSYTEFHVSELILPVEGKSVDMKSLTHRFNGHDAETVIDLRLYRYRIFSRPDHASLPYPIR